MMYDELFAGLDPISLNQIVELIRSLNHTLGLTSIVVTYDVKEALKVADYIYVIGDGTIVEAERRRSFRLPKTRISSSFSTRFPTASVRSPLPRAAARGGLPHPWLKTISSRQPARR